MLRSVAWILGVILLAGWPSLAMPFRGDEALFVVVGKQLAGGAVLYRDYWDITNPGIFWFYQFAGMIFGFTEFGIRAFEWLWMTTFVFVLSEFVRRRDRTSKLPLAPSLFVGAIYYLSGYSYTSTLTKTEGLIGLPMVLAIAGAAHAVNGARFRGAALVLGGMAGAVVLLFKLLLGGCLAVAWLYLWGKAIHASPRKARTAVHFASFIVLGLGLVLGLVLAYFAHHGQLGTVFRTLVELPPQFLAEGQRADLDRLAVSVKWFLGQYAAVMAAAVLAVGTHLRSRSDPFVMALVLVGLASFAAILVQRLSWWPYHFLLPGTLAGVLAAQGWPAVAKILNDLPAETRFFRRGKLVVAAGFLLLEPLGAGGYVLLKLARHNFGLSAATREEFRSSFGTAYQDAEGETAWLRERSVRPGAVLVCGDPLYYLFAQREPATRISGWSLELYPAVLREEFTEEVRRKRPVYVYVSAIPHGYDRLLRERFPGLAKHLEQTYQPVRTTRAGVWYRVRDFAE